MKQGIVLLIVFFSCFNSYCQSLDRNISQLANGIVGKVTKKNKIHLAVGDFVNNAGKSDALTNYIAQQIETKLINSDSGLEILDRKHIKLLLSENHLQSEGLIDESTAKSAVSFIKVDGWVFGEVTSFDDQIKITIRVVDISTSIIFAAGTSDLIDDRAIRKLIESTQEQSMPVDKNCQQNKTGDFCFRNTLKRKVIVYISHSSAQANMTHYGGDDQQIIIEAGENQCFYTLLSQNYYYTVYPIAIDPATNAGNGFTYLPCSQGTILVNTCMVKKIEIR